MDNNFAVFILSHGRAEKVITMRALDECGYTGKRYIVVDNEDTELDKYKELFGDMVVVFDKVKISKTFDTGDNFQDRRAIIYARNACFEIAKDLGIEYFMQLDDDYETFDYKFDSELVYDEKRILSLNGVITALIDYYKKIPALSIAMAQGGDFMGGSKGSFGKQLKMKRKAMNSFICSVNRKFQFIGRINEDVNTYCNLGSRGLLFLTIPNIVLHQKTTQKNKGGMTEMYKESGTYVKSFYTVMYNPSSVKIGMMGARFKRLHHQIDWNCTVPKIINERFKKL